MKLWLRELKDPLLTFEHYEMFIYCMSFQETEEQISKIQNVLLLLPKGNFMVLDALIKLLRKVSQNQQVNKMSSQNLAIIFSPNILKSK